MRRLFVLLTSVLALFVLASCFEIPMASEKDKINDEAKEDLADVLVSSADSVDAKTFQIGGIDPDLAELSESAESAGKNLDILRKAVQKCNLLKTGHLVFPRGVYEIGNEQTLKDMDSLMTGKIHPFSTFKDVNIAMNFSHAENLVVDGQGCTLVFSGLIQPFEIDDCKNVVIKNITIDWKRPLFSEGIVRMVKNETLEVEVFPEFPVHGGEPVVSFQSFSLATGHLSGVCKFEGISNLKLIAPQTVRLTADEAKFVKIGDIVIIRHIYSYRPGINLFNCDNVLIQDVTFYALPGMGVFGTRTRDITLKRYSVRPSGKRIMSINVDGSHFVSCRGTVELDGCYFQGMGDDAFNMHGRYYTIGEVIDEKTVRATHQNEDNYPDAGDKVEFVRENTLYSYDEAVIVSVDYDPQKNESVITFDRPLPTNFEKSDLLANISQHAKLIFTNCTVRDIRGRALLVQTRDVLIENNNFEYCTGQGIHVLTANPRWNESVGTRDVVIRNNTFLNCGFGSTTYCDAIGVVVETECPEPFVGVHRNIVIENNLIIGHTRPAFYLSCLDGAVIRGNRIISDGPAARLEYAVNVEFENNNFEEEDVVIGPGCENRGIIKFQKE